MRKTRMLYFVMVILLALAFTSTASANSDLPVPPDGYVLLAPVAPQSAPGLWHIVAEGKSKGDPANWCYWQEGGDRIWTEDDYADAMQGIGSLPKSVVSNVSGHYEGPPVHYADHAMDGKESETADQNVLVNWLLCIGLFGGLLWFAFRSKKRRGNQFRHLRT